MGAGDGGGTGARNRCLCFSETMQNVGFHCSYREIISMRFSFSEVPSPVPRVQMGPLTKKMEVFGRANKLNGLSTGQVFWASNGREFSSVAIADTSKNFSPPAI